ncbi:adaptor protein [Nitrososphaeria virus YSH_1032793]|uniref:Adaptor protein n=1 Tax=Nitrososphaeria virus YSH_1032793 TaxID=3071320 RepID=A0A976UB88_9CAUD|nr:adaptor protein [Yangshan Harbor Nitrososphaeria virus]UVF62240.1 adaptor protein [Nitrososphaeria virus YSH_1032793]
MAYYTLATVKSDLGVTNTDYDTVLTNIGTNADSEIDEEIKIITRRNKNSTLPDLPLSTVPQTIVEASHALMKSKFFQRPDNFRPELVKVFNDEYKKKVELYVSNLEDVRDVSGDVF